MTLFEQLQSINAKLDQTRDQNREVQQSISSIENERREIQKEINLEIINSSVFLEDIKKLNFQLYLDLECPKLFSENNEYSPLLQKVKYDLDSLVDRQIYLKEKVHFESSFSMISIRSKSMKDLLEFAKKHKLKWITKTSKILDEEISDLKDQLSNLNKFKKLVEKYK